MKQIDLIAMMQTVHYICLYTNKLLPPRIVKKHTIILIHSIHESNHFSQEQFFLQNISWHAPELQNFRCTKVCKHLRKVIF